MDCYFDSSALVKLYVLETGSPWVKQWVEERLPTGELRHTVSMSRLAIVETAAAIARRRRMGELTVEQQALLYRRLLEDAQHRFQLLEVDGRSLELAADLTQHHPLRGYDAVHLAAALRLWRVLVTADLPAPVFVCADANLCAVALTAELAVDNPNDHP
jgi:predicted nucleic acid-binding protein